MSREYMIGELKKILTYSQKWYNKLSDKQVYAIYMKYCINGYKSKKQLEEEYDREPKLVKRRVTEDGFKQVLADNGRWENEFD